MFVTFLRFADNRSAAPEFMAVHNDWIARGFTDGVFLCVGSFQPAVGGAIIAHAESRDDARLSRSRRSGFVIGEALMSFAASASASSDLRDKARLCSSSLKALPIFSNSSGPIGSKLKVCAEFIVSPFPPPCDGRALCVSCFDRLC
ncbi:hypothetical protein SS05631_b51250 (plasmid) [Sinorhizobium sp. CCBAU 05631]|nr:hypothetical protein SS05631_b51250 [Sinorhizobium sp. CCBAU 05631]